LSVIYRDIASGGKTQKINQKAKNPPESGGFEVKILGIIRLGACPIGLQRNFCGLFLARLAYR
jgi:hypothetical protein